MLEPIFADCGRRDFTEFGYLKASKILVVQPDLIGDFLLFSPFLRELRRRYSTAWITLVVEPQVFNLAEHCPYVDEILFYDCKKWSRYWRWQYFAVAAKLAAQHLWSRKFDLALFPHWEIDHYYGTMVAYLSGATYRVGYSEFTTHEKSIVNHGYDLLLSSALSGNGVQHEVEQNLGLLRALGIEPIRDNLEIWLSERDRQYSEKFLLSRKKPQKPLIAICIGGSHPRKQWPIDRYLEVCKFIIEKFDAELIVVGDKRDAAIATCLDQELSGALLNACGKTSLRQTAALLSHCRMYVGNDTAPMHMAAAFRVPVVAVSCHPVNGSSERAYAPARFGPWQVPNIVVQPEKAALSCLVPDLGVKDELICDYCIASGAHCILGVSTSAVIEAVNTLFAKTSEYSRADIMETTSAVSEK